MSAELGRWLGKAVVVGIVCAVIAFALGFAVYPYFYPSNLAPMTGFFVAPFGFLLGFLGSLLWSAGQLGTARLQGFAIVGAVMALVWALLMTSSFIPGFVIRANLLEADFLPALLKGPLAPAGTLQIWAIDVPAAHQHRHRSSVTGPVLTLHGHHEFSFPSRQELLAAYRQPSTSSPRADVVVSKEFAPLAELLAAPGMHNRFVRVVSPTYASMDRFAFIDREGQHLKLARQLALDNRECRRPALAETTLPAIRAELEERVLKLAASLVSGEPPEQLFADSRHRMHLEHVGDDIGQPVRIDSLRFCGAWGSANLALARVSIAYETPWQLGRSLLTLALRQEEGQWRLLAVSENWRTESSLDIAALPLQRALSQGDSSGEPIRPAEPRAPHQYVATSEASQRSGYLLWTPSASPTVVAEVAEIACRTLDPHGNAHDSIQLSIHPREAGTEPTYYLAASTLCSNGWPWKWRLWTVSHNQLQFSAEQDIPLPKDN